MIEPGRRSSAYYELAWGDRSLDNSWLHGCKRNYPEFPRLLLDKPVEEIFTEYPLTPEAPRITIKSSTFDGMLSSPTTPGKTVVLMQIGKAAAKTDDIFRLCFCRLMRSPSHN